MKTFEELMKQETPKLLNCVHCGLCLDECPTYRQSGDENNSPRGRLALWRGIAEGRIQADSITDYYTDQCVGCMACVSACPANVPYGELLVETRAMRVREGAKVDWRLRVAAALIPQKGLFNFLLSPLRLLRRAPLTESSAAYAATVNAALKPSKGKAALLSGCLMDAAYRDLNFATLRVLAANGYEVSVPEDQACCGAFHEHAGLPGKEALDQANQKAFASAEVVITNSSGCGLALRHALGPKQRDLGDFLNGLDLKKGAKLSYSHIYYDIPCHAIHGLGLKNPPSKILDALGVAWELAPDADRCCGSGGSYALTHPHESGQIIREKSAFLDSSPYKNPVLATANHVCLRQWQSAPNAGRFKARHIVELLDESYQRAGFYAGPK